MKFTNIIITCLCFFSLNVYANEEIDKLTLPILESIHKGEINNLFSMAYPKGSPTRKYFSDSDVEQYNTKFQGSFQALGKSSGYFEYLHSEIPSVLVLKYYVIKFDIEPVIVKFILYKQNDKWRINAFELDDALDDYLEKSAKSRLGDLSHQDIREEIKANKSLKQDK
ncbi:hypothetical protein [Pseudocolwellia agarivorans]|uniref:hypothetical protein n=1 Tax=Pseudocolwellia agarivorans TaxID=1911682 RepID=UPI0009851395|nr:hypothetical protein [Pseudocolwellia agarivorans]